MLKNSIFLLLMFHLFLDFLKKFVKKGEGGCYFFQKGGELRVAGDKLKREGLKLVTKYALYVRQR